MKLLFLRQVYLNNKLDLSQFFAGTGWSCFYSPSTVFFATNILKELHIRWKSRGFSLYGNLYDLVSTDPVDA